MRTCKLVQIRDFARGGVLSIYELSSRLFPIHYILPLIFVVIHIDYLISADIILAIRWQLNSLVVSTSY
jgi:hypothetical protein